jgi:hypothetical protein
MTHFYNPTTKLVKTLDAIREDNPYSSIPEGADLSSLGYLPVIESEEPAYDTFTEDLRYSVVSDLDNNYNRVWEVYPLPSETIQANKTKQADEIKASVTAYAQNRLDNFAKTKGYDDIKSACSYYGSSVARFNQDAIDALDVRSRTWDILDQLEADVTNGIKTCIMTIGELEAILPVLKWS